MKELRYILAIFLSSLIIIGGVGVTISQYCCMGCKAVQETCCAGGCSKCHKSHQKQSQGSCKDKGCTTVHYKVDLVKTSSETFSLVPAVFTLFCETVPQFCFTMPTTDLLPDAVACAPPSSSGGRHYLALYSTLLI
ncbi:MAG: hypothetical protein Q4D56_09620 [Bacteroides sp.]|nr:hypothetical protein [Bacteroides sp.]